MIILLIVMNIIVLTPIYATTTEGSGATPVVHYFTREWVRMGHKVTVFQFVAKYPGPMYWVGRHFQHQLNTRLGMLVPVEKPKDEDYEADGVAVHKRRLKKFKPHSRYNNARLEQALDIVSNEIEKSGVPDWFVGHWDNPQLELLDMLKTRFNKPTCLVFHSNDFNIEAKYGDEGRRMLIGLDVIGFRSMVGQRTFEAKYWKPKRSFIASSGVSETFLQAGNQIQKSVKQPVHNFVYVGSLIERKYPSLIVAALSEVYPDGDFSMTFIGDGAEKSVIEEEYHKTGRCGKLHFTGRIPREEIIQYLKQADVFVMISKDEIFGLVYLEAMALGVIPIGSKNEGIDGIIVDGENGFLCEAGNKDELAVVLKRIKELPSEELEAISIRAKETARHYSDEGVARKYIDNLSN